jgi:hypothetical protein
MTRYVIGPDVAVRLAHDQIVIRGDHQVLRREGVRIASQGSPCCSPDGFVPYLRAAALAAGQLPMRPQARRWHIRQIHAPPRSC